MVELILEVLPGEHDYGTVETSVRHMAGVHVDRSTLHKACWRIAGNTKRLKQRRPVPPWHVQRLPEWVPAQIVSCRRQKNSKDKIGGMFGFRILAGTSCPSFVFKWWSVTYCRFISNELGFTRQRGRRPSKYPYTDPEQFVNLRLYLKIDPDECDKEPGFSEIAFNDSMKEWNDVTRKCRQRTQPGFECAMGVQDAAQLPCWKCPIGYQTCRAGTHRLDWEQRHCAHCGEDDAWFDPDAQGDFCVECYAKDLYGRNKKA